MHLSIPPIFKGRKNPIAFGNRVSAEALLKNAESRDPMGLDISRFESLLQLVTDGWDVLHFRSGKPEKTGSTRDPMGLDISRFESLLQLVTDGWDVLHFRSGKPEKTGSTRDPGQKTAWYSKSFPSKKLSKGCPQALERN